jgi:hypothetical protein
MHHAGISLFVHQTQTYFLKNLASNSNLRYENMGAKELKKGKKK